MFKMTVLYKERLINERVCNSVQFERDQSFLGGYECKGISLRYSAHLVDDLQSRSTKIPTMSQYSATETAFVSCSLSAFLCRFLKKKFVVVS